MAEPNALLRWAIYLFAGGDAGFWGALMIAVTAFMGLRPDFGKTIRPRQCGIVFGLGLVLIACASPPIPLWFTCTTICWLATVLIEIRLRSIQSSSSREDSQAFLKSRWQFLFCFSPLVWIAAALVLELPYRFWSPSSETVSTVLVIGDSVTAGLNDDDDTWPKQLPRERNVNVSDASQPGATLRSAYRQNEVLSGESGLVILEIGGNDMLEGLSVRQFEENLNRLLSVVESPGRSIVMFELPLPPLCAAYGSVQRRLAARYKVKLIPKRFFAELLTTSGSTVDGIHLSNQGQTRLTRILQSLLGNQLRPGTGTYRKLEYR